MGNGVASQTAGALEGESHTIKYVCMHLCMYVKARTQTTQQVKLWNDSQACQYMSMHGYTCVDMNTFKCVYKFNDVAFAVAGVQTFKYKIIKKYIKP